MGTEDDAATFGHFAQFFDKDCTGGTQLIDNMPIVDNFFADVNRRAIQIERNSNDIDGTYHAGAEAAGLQQNDLLGSLFCRDRVRSREVVGKTNERHKKTYARIITIRCTDLDIGCGNEEAMYCS